MSMMDYAEGEERFYFVNCYVRYLPTGIRKIDILFSINIKKISYYNSVK